MRAVFLALSLELCQGNMFRSYLVFSCSLFHHTVTKSRGVTTNGSLYEPLHQGWIYCVTPSSTGPNLMVDFTDFLFSCQNVHFTKLSNGMCVHPVLQKAAWPLHVLNSSNSNTQTKPCIRLISSIWKTCKRMVMEKSDNSLKTSQQIILFPFYKFCKYLMICLSFRYFHLTEIYIQIWNKNDKLLAGGLHWLFFECGNVCLAMVDGVLGWLYIILTTQTPLFCSRINTISN